MPDNGDPLQNANLFALSPGGTDNAKEALQKRRLLQVNALRGMIPEFNEYDSEEILKVMVSRLEGRSPAKSAKLANFLRQRVPKWEKKADHEIIGELSSMLEVPGPDPVEGVIRRRLSKSGPALVPPGNLMRATTAAARPKTLPKARPTLIPITPMQQIADVPETPVSVPAPSAPLPSSTPDILSPLDTAAAAASPPVRHAVTTPEPASLVSVPATGIIPLPPMLTPDDAAALYQMTTTPGARTVDAAVGREITGEKPRARAKVKRADIEEQQFAQRIVQKRQREEQGIRQQIQQAGAEANAQAQAQASIQDIQRVQDEQRQAETRAYLENLSQRTELPVQTLMQLDKPAIESQAQYVEARRAQERQDQYAQARDIGKGIGWEAEHMMEDARERIKKIGNAGYDWAGTDTPEGKLRREQQRQARMQAQRDYDLAEQAKEIASDIENMSETDDDLVRTITKSWNANMGERAVPFINALTEMDSLGRIKDVSKKQRAWDVYQEYVQAAQSGTTQTDWRTWLQQNGKPGWMAEYENEPLTPNEDTLLRAVATQAAAQGLAPSGGVARIGADITFQMIPYIAEFVATGGGYAVGRKAGEKAVTGALGAVSRKAAESTAGKFIARNVGRAAGSLVQSAINVPAVASETMRRMQDGPVAKIADGEIQRIDYQDGKDFGEALLRTTVNRWIEFATERGGEFIGRGAAKLKAATRKKLIEKYGEGWAERIKPSVLGTWLAKQGARSESEIVSKMRGLTKWDGPIGEFAEEMIAMGPQNIVEEQPFFKGYDDPELLAGILVGVGAFGGVAGAGAKVINKMADVADQRRKTKHRGAEEELLWAMHEDDAAQEERQSIFDDLEESIRGARSDEQQAYMRAQVDILRSAEIPEDDIPDYVQDSVADGAILGTHARDVVAGEKTVDEAAEMVRRDYEKMKSGRKVAPNLQEVENASEIRSDTGLPTPQGIQREEGKADRSRDVQQTAQGRTTAGDAGEPARGEAPVVTPKDGWRDSFIKAREYAINLGLDWQEIEKPGTSAADKRARLVAAIDTHLQAPGARAGEGAPTTVAPGETRVAPPESIVAGQEIGEPTEAQKEAMNYKMGHDRWKGIPFSIENEKGSVRSGTDADGKSWSIEMKDDYGKFLNTVGKDKDHIDVFFGPHRDSDVVLVVNQKNSDGSFDEHKIIAGFNNRSAAEEGYLRNYAPDWLEKQGGKLDAVLTTPETLKKWFASGNTKQRFTGDVTAAAPEKMGIKQPSAEQQQRSQRIIDAQQKAVAQRLIDEKEPVPINDVIKHGIVLPAGYEESGEFYVYKPTAREKREQKRAALQAKAAAKAAPAKKITLPPRTAAEQVDIADINVDTERFQGRADSYSEETVQRIMESVQDGTFRWEDFDDVKLWKDPKGKLWMLAGHSRLEAFRRLSEQDPEFRMIPAKVSADIDEKQAISVARQSNVLATRESDLDRAKFYRGMREEGRSKTEIKKDAAKYHGRDAERILAYSYLNPKGKLFTDLGRVSKGAGEETLAPLRKMAQWVGAAREMYPELSDLHENELYDYLREGSGKSIRTQGQFTERLTAVADPLINFGELAPDKRLNIENRAIKGGVEQEYDARLTAAETEVKTAKKALDAKRTELVRRGASRDDMDRVLKPYNDAVILAQKEYIRLREQGGTVRQAAQQQGGLFEEPATAPASQAPGAAREAEDTGAAPAPIAAPAGSIRTKADLDAFLKTPEFTYYKTWIQPKWGLVKGGITQNVIKRDKALARGDADAVRGYEAKIDEKVQEIRDAVREGMAALAAEKAAATETPRGEKIPKGWMYLGENSNSESVFLDHRGNRAVMEHGGITSYAPVPIFPTREGGVGMQPQTPEELYKFGRTEYLTADEKQAFDAKNAPEAERGAAPEPAPAPTKEDEVRARIAALAKKFNQQVNSKAAAGIDPAAMTTAVELALAYTELGVYKFADFARQVYEVAGKTIKPYLKGAYMAVKQQLDRDARRLMDTEDTVDDADIDAILAGPEALSNEAWWGSLTAAGKRVVLDAAGRKKTPEKVNWRHMGAEEQSAVAALRGTDVDPVAKAAEAAPEETKEPDTLSRTAITDTNGQPLRVYRAATSEYGTQRKGEKYSDVDRGIGTFFAESPSTAAMFVTARNVHGAMQFDVETGNPIYEEGSNITPAHLLIENPKTYDTFMDYWKEITGAGSGTALREMLQKQGYDGIVIEEGIPDKPDYGRYIVAFDHAQVYGAISREPLPWSPEDENPFGDTKTPEELEDEQNPPAGDDYEGGRLRDSARRSKGSRKKRDGRKRNSAKVRGDVAAPPVVDESGDLPVGSEGGNAAEPRVTLESRIPEKKALRAIDAALADLGAEPAGIRDGVAMFSYTDDAGVTVELSRDQMIAHGLELLMRDTVTSPVGEGRKDIRLDANSPIRLKPAERLNMNMRALHILYDKAEHEITDEDREVLRQYTGWGGLRDQMQNPEIKAELIGIVGKAGYNRFLESVTNAHYTDYPIIAFMYEKAKALGFEGGAIYEPGSGIGNFAGLRPDGYEFDMVEIEPETARIASILYPEQRVFATGIERFGRAGYDGMFGNVPFGDFTVPMAKSDPYRKLASSIHWYAVMNGIDRLEANGLGAIISATAILDSHGEKATEMRRMIDQQAEFIGAYRLPSGTFGKNAHTQVTTDILFFRKRMEGEAYAPDEEFINSDPQKLAHATYGDMRDTHYSRYYANHPENVLGEMLVGYQAQGPEQIGVKGNVSEERLDELLADGMRPSIRLRAPGDSRVSKENAAGQFAAPANMPIGRMTARNGKVYVKNGQGMLEPIRASEQTLRAVEIMDDFNSILPQMAAKTPPSETEGMRLRITKRLTDWWEKYGDPRFNQQFSSAFSTNPDKYVFINLRDKKGKFRPVLANGILLTEKMQAKVGDPESVADVARYLFLRDAKVTTENFAALYRNGVSTDEALRALDSADDIFLDPEANVYQPATMYLSGHIGMKLLAARGMLETSKGKEGAEMRARMEKNIAALLRERPPAIPVNEIKHDLRIGYVDLDIMEKFASDVANDGKRPIRIKRNIDLELTKGQSGQIAGQALRYTVEEGESKSFLDRGKESQTNKERGVGGKTWTASLEMYLNNNSFRMRNLTEEEKAIPGMYEAAKEEAKQLTAQLAILNTQFTEWLGKPNNNDMAIRVQEGWNLRYNSYRSPNYTGKDIHIEGLSDTFYGAPTDIYPWHFQMLERYLYTGRAINAHDVGSGKTISSILMTRMAKQQGRANKPMVVVPAKTIGKWEQEYLDLFPDATVINLGKLPSEKRNDLLVQAAFTDADVILISEEGFKQIPISNELLADYLAQDWENAMQALRAQNIADPEAIMRILDQYEKDEAERKVQMALYEKEHGKKPKKKDFPEISLESYGKGESKEVRDALRDKSTVNTIKQAVRVRVKLEQAVRDSQEKAQGGIPFDMMGVDMLIVDEAHNFKNVFTWSTLNYDIPGIGKDPAKRAIDMQYKARYILDANNRQSVVFLTATPATSSPAEVYNMVKLLAPDIWENQGIYSFDNFLLTYSEPIERLSLGADQTYITKKVIERWKNLPQLQAAVNSIMDMRSMEELMLTMPEDKRQNLRPKAKIVPVLVEPSRQQLAYMAALIDRAENVRAALRSRMHTDDSFLKITGDGRRASVDLRAVGITPDENPRFDALMDNIMSEYKKYPEGNQIIFVDQYRFKLTGGNLHDEFRAELVKRGIPDAEIEHVSDTRNTKPEDRKRVQDMFNMGKVRILIGSTGMIGEGMNLQEKTVAIHHYDAPWTPAGIDQRNGRAVRQGNDNDEVRVYQYATRKTFDEMVFDKLSQKASWIRDLFRTNRDVAINEGDIAFDADEILSSLSDGAVRAVYEARRTETAAGTQYEYWKSYVSTLDNKSRGEMQFRIQYAKETLAQANAIEKAKLRGVELESKRGGGYDLAHLQYQLPDSNIYMEATRSERTVLLSRKGKPYKISENQKTVTDRDGTTRDLHGFTDDGYIVEEKRDVFILSFFLLDPNFKGTSRAIAFPYQTGAWQTGENLITAKQGETRLELYRRLPDAGMDMLRRAKDAVDATREIAQAGIAVAEKELERITADLKDANAQLQRSYSTWENAMAERRTAEAHLQDGTQDANQVPPDLPTHAWIKVLEWFSLKLAEVGGDAEALKPTNAQLRYYDRVGPIHSPMNMEASIATAPKSSRKVGKLSYQAVVRGVVQQKQYSLALDGVNEALQLRRDAHEIAKEYNSAEAAAEAETYYEDNEKPFVIASGGARTELGTQPKGKDYFVIRTPGGDPIILHIYEQAPRWEGDRTRKLLHAYEAVSGARITAIPIQEYYEGDNAKKYVDLVADAVNEYYAKIGPEKFTESRRREIQRNGIMPRYSQTVPVPPAAEMPGAAPPVVENEPVPIDDQFGLTLFPVLFRAKTQGPKAAQAPGTAPAAAPLSAAPTPGNYRRSVAIARGIRKALTMAFAPRTVADRLLLGDVAGREYHDEITGQNFKAALAATTLMDDEIQRLLTLSEREAAAKIPHGFEVRNWWERTGRRLPSRKALARLQRYHEEALAGAGWVAMWVRMDPQGNMVFGGRQKWGIISRKDGEALTQLTGIPLYEGYVMDDGRIVGEEYPDGSRQLYREMDASAAKDAWDTFVKTFPEAVPYMEEYIKYETQIEHLQALGEKVPLLPFNRQRMTEYLKQADPNFTGVENYLHGLSLKRKKAFSMASALLRKRTPDMMKLNRGILAATDRRDYNLSRVQSEARLNYLTSELKSEQAGVLMALVSQPWRPGTPLMPGYTPLNLDDADWGVVRRMFARTRPYWEKKGIPVGQLIVGTYQIQKHWQIPTALQDELLGFIRPSGEKYADSDVQRIMDVTGKLVNGIINSINATHLIRPGTAATNYLSGELQIMQKTIADLFYFGMTGSKEGLIDLKNNFTAIYRRLSPAARREWDKRIPKEIFGRTFFQDLGNTKGEEGVTNKLLKPFQAVEVLFKARVYDMTLHAEAEKLARRDKRWLHSTVDQRREMVRDLAAQPTAEMVRRARDVADQFTYDYANVPRWLANLKKKTIFRTILPYPTYFYKFAGQLTRGIWDVTGIVPNKLRGAPGTVRAELGLGKITANQYETDSAVLRALEQAGYTPQHLRKIANFLATGGMTWGLSLLMGSGDDEERGFGSIGNLQSPEGDPYNEHWADRKFDATNRILIKETDSALYYLRAIKYPFIREAMTIKMLREGQFEIGNYFGDLISTGSTFNLGLHAIGQGDKYNEFKPFAAVMGETIASDIPLAPYLNDARNFIDSSARDSWDKDKGWMTNLWMGFASKMPWLSLLLPSKFDAQTGQEREYPRSLSLWNFATGLRLKEVKKEELDVREFFGRMQQAYPRKKVQQESWFKRLTPAGQEFVEAHWDELRPEIRRAYADVQKVKYNSLVAIRRRAKEQAIAPEDQAALRETWEAYGDGLASQAKAQAIMRVINDYYNKQGAE